VARRGSELRRVLTLGGQAPLPAGALLVAMVLATVAGTLSPALAGWLVLVVPRADAASWPVLLQAWRLLTWPLVQEPLPRSLFTLLFAGLMLVWLGRQLCAAWGDRRFLLRVLILSGGAGLGTLLVLATLGWPSVHFGAWAVVNALLVTWGLIYPHQRLSWFGAVEMTGATVAKAFTAGTPVWAVVVGWSQLGLLGALADYLPHLLAIGLAWLMVAGGPRRAWFRAREWWLRLTLERQRRKFKVISTDRPPPKTSMN